MHPTIDEGDDGYSVYGHPSSVFSNNSTRVSAPPYIMRETPRRHQWSTDLFHCLDDPPLCFVTCCCPCITFGLIAEILDKGNPPCCSSGAIYGLLALTGFACLYSCTYRSKMRAHYHLAEAPCMDCLVHFCCETCALAQEYRQLQNLGFDLSIGWEGNTERQRQAVTVAPSISAGMNR